MERKQPGKLLRSWIKAGKFGNDRVCEKQFVELTGLVAFFPALDKLVIHFLAVPGFALWCFRVHEATFSQGRSAVVKVPEASLSSKARVT